MPSICAGEMDAGQFPSQHQQATTIRRHCSQLMAWCYNCEADNAGAVGVLACEGTGQAVLLLFSSSFILIFSLTFPLTQYRVAD